MSSYIQLVGTPIPKPRLPAKTLKLLNVYRDELDEFASSRAMGVSDEDYEELKSNALKARRELVKHLLKP